MEEPPDCKYKGICKFYNNCKPVQYEIYMSSCWKKNFFDNTLSKNFIKSGILENIIEGGINDETNKRHE